MELGKNLKGSLREYSKLIISLVVTLVIVNILLIYLGQREPEVYFIANAIAYFTISLFFANINNRVRITLSSIGIIIFIGFWIIVLEKVAQILKSTLIK